jgi:hypothetical protein
MGIDSTGSISDSRVSGAMSCSLGQVTAPNRMPTRLKWTGRLEPGVFGVSVWRIVVLVVDQVQADDDAVEHGNDGHAVALLMFLLWVVVYAINRRSGYWSWPIG